ncbi:hypothetical protein [Streptomyces sp. NPDC091215]|uniref:hypothetical protein n=1 Tax=Streptomyces sp. NPDC091215 TaxID=3155192 RepID=UPI00341E5EE3
MVASSNRDNAIRLLSAVNTRRSGHCRRGALSVENMSLPLTVLSGTSCSTSQCSAIFPSWTRKNRALFAAA